MAAGISTIRFLSAGPAGRVKKQLNDLYLHMSYKIHKELCNFGVIAVRAAAAAGAGVFTGAPRSGGNATTATDASVLRVVPTNPNLETAKDWEANVTLWVTADTSAAPLANAKQVGRPKLDQVNGERILLVVDSPMSDDLDITVQIGAIRKSDPAPVGPATDKPYMAYTMMVTKGAGIGQALTLVDDAGQIVDDVIAIDWDSLVAGSIGYDSVGAALVDPIAAVQGADRGSAFKIISVPVAEADWIYHAFVRQINPNIPKDYREVADHFDGAADTIRAIAIPTLGIQKVFENVPGSFMNLRTRRVTMRADVRENNRFDPSEIHYFLGVKGTPTITFNNDNESIAAMECIMYRWVTLS